MFFKTIDLKKLFTTLNLVIATLFELMNSYSEKDRKKIDKLLCFPNPINLTFYSNATFTHQNMRER